MLQYLLHRLTVSPDKSGQRSELHKRICVPTKPLPARPALLHQVSTSLHCRPYVVCCQQGLECCRHLERRLPVSGLERGPACHPERELWICAAVSPDPKRSEGVTGILSKCLAILF